MRQETVLVLGPNEMRDQLQEFFLDALSDESFREKLVKNGDLGSIPNFSNMSADDLANIYARVWVWHDLFVKWTECNTIVLDCGCILKVVARREWQPGKTVEQYIYAPR